jgi:hypothetical protein
MLRPHAIQVAGEFAISHYRGWIHLSEPLLLKGEILLWDRQPLASRFDPRPCGKKTTTIAKAGMPRYCRLRAAPAPEEVATPAPPLNRDRRHSDKSATI